MDGGQDYLRRNGNPEDIIEIDVDGNPIVQEVEENKTVDTCSSESLGTSWHAYPKAYNLGHRALKDLFVGPVLVEEKVDGSQFSFGTYINGGGVTILRCRSKGTQLNLVAPEKMFTRAIETVQKLQPNLKIGWTYRAEYLAKPKHNTYVYDRIPKDHLIIFDVNRGEEDYLSYEEKQKEAGRLGLETVPAIYQGTVDDITMFRELLETTSILGGQKVEGLVIKNYAQFGPDGKVVMGKFVSEEFREAHTKDWKESNPGGKDIIVRLREVYRTTACWQKSVQHLQEEGKLEQSPRDIGLLIKAVQTDIEEECSDEIKDALFKWAWGDIRRGVVRGLPEWYKEELLKAQFESEDERAMLRGANASH